MFYRFHRRLGPRALLGILVLSLAFGLRIWNFPDPYEVRSTDEVGYLSGGLLLWEGITPGFKMAPAAPLTWLGWGYAAILSGKYFWASRGSGEGSSFFLRPFYAIDSALFDLYRDLTILRRGVLWLGLGLSLLGVAAACASGFFRAGWPGGLLAGGLAATLPQFVLQSGKALPYGWAWSFALMAHFFAATRSGRPRWLGAGILMALAASSRLEMLAFIPILVWEFWYRPEWKDGSLGVRRFLGITLLFLFLLAPWLITNLLGNLRALVTIRFFGPDIQETGGSTLKEFFLQEGMAPAFFLLVLGFFRSLSASHRRFLPLGLILCFSFLSLLKGTGYGMRHHGEVFLAVISCAPVALLGLETLSPRLLLFLLFPAFIFPFSQSIQAISSQRDRLIVDRATDWIRHHIPSGTPLYLYPTFYDPLPTPQAADRLWNEVTHANAWRKKFEEGLKHSHLPMAHPPRALSEEHLIQERGNRRRWFILGGRPEIREPRYHIHLYSGGSPFDILSPEVIEQFQRTGGALVWRGYPLEKLGPPAVSWTGRQNRGTFIYFRPSPKDSLGG
jgi:hypothetical protein